ERALGLELVMGVAPKSDAGHRRLAAAREFLDMIELEPRAGRAPVPGLAHERALGAVALPDGALDLRRDVTRVGPGSATARPRLGGRGELLPLELGGQRLERPREHRGHVPRRDLVAEQRLRVAQVVVLA